MTDNYQRNKEEVTPSLGLINADPTPPLPIDDRLPPPGLSRVRGPP